MRFRIAVERGPLTRIAIFNPDELHLPDSQKQYFTEVTFGVLGEDKTDFLESNDLFFDGERVGVDLDRLQSRLGHSDLNRLIMPVDAFRKFLEQHRDKDQKKE